MAKKRNISEAEEVRTSPSDYRELVHSDHPPRIAPLLVIVDADLGEQQLRPIDELAVLIAIGIVESVVKWKQKSNFHEVQSGKNQEGTGVPWQQGKPAQSVSNKTMLAPQPTIIENALIENVPLVDPVPLNAQLAEMLFRADEVAPKPKPTRAVSEADLECLKTLLGVIKDAHISNKYHFVETINRFLEVSQRRIELGNGERCWLRVVNRPSGSYIHLIGQNGKHVGRLGTKAISLSEQID